MAELVEPLSEAVKGLCDPREETIDGN